MRRLLGLLVIMGLATFAVPSYVSAQDRPMTRGGFFIGFGFGYGSFSVEDAGEREASGSGYLKLGGTLNERVLLGVESNVWLKEELGVTITAGTVAGIIQFYPNPESGFYLKGGPGFTQIEVDAGGGLSVTDDGFGFLAGVGYEARLGNNFSLSPYGNYIYASHDGGNWNQFQLGLGVIWH